MVLMKTRYVAPEQKLTYGFVGIMKYFPDSKCAADCNLLLENGSNGADFRKRYYNRDGGEAEMCGNDARCFARFANKIAAATARVSFQTPSGLIRGELRGELVTLQMSEPKDLRLN